MSDATVAKSTSERSKTPRVGSPLSRGQDRGIDVILKIDALIALHQQAQAAHGDAITSLQAQRAEAVAINRAISGRAA